jgi:hypothetical protein
MILYKAEGPLGIHATDGTISTSTGAASSEYAVLVSPSAATRLALTGGGAETAGVADPAIAFSALDAYGNTDTTYVGDKSITFSGAADSPDPVTHPTVVDKNTVAQNFGTATTLTFVAGALTITMTLVKAEVTNVAATDGSISAAGTDRYAVTTTAGVATRLQVTGTGAKVAGSAQNLTLNAVDDFGNLDLTYTGDQSITFSGANASPSPTTQPTATDKTGAAVDFGSATTITFANGTVTAAGGNNGVMTLYAAETAYVAITDGALGPSAGTDRLMCIVSSDAAASLTILGAATEDAGVSQNLTIDAVDVYGNIDPTYVGDKSLTFSGANSSTNPVTAPTVTNKTGVATNFGSATTITFTLGEATVSGSNNGKMTLYKAEVAAVAVTDGALSETAALTVTVSALAASRLVVTGTGAEPVNTADALTITATDTYGNTDTTYTGDKSLVYSGANSSTNPVTAPTVTNKLAAAIAFGSATVTTFALGVNTVGGSALFYKAETALVAVTDGTIAASTGSDRLTVVVTAATVAKFKTAGSATQVAGAAQAITLTAQDAYGNTDLTYSGDKVITFAGANPSTNPATNPTVTDKTPSAIDFGTNTTITFTSGVNSAGGSMVLYKAESAVIIPTASVGGWTSAGSDRLSVTVTAATIAKFKTTGTAAPVAGSSHALTITAQDAYGNTDLTYSGDKAIVFTGANPSTDPITAPTVTNKTASAIAFGSSTVITFTSGVNSAGGALVLYLVEVANIVPTASVGGWTSAGANRLTATVTAGTATRLKVTGSGTQTAGVSQNLTLTALDAYGNTDLTYTGDQALTFSGANDSPSPATTPTASDKTGAATDFGVATTITFTNGTVTAAGGNNGAMLLYKAESANISVTDGSILAAGTDILTVVVSEAALNKYAIVLASEEYIGVTFLGTNTLTAEDTYGNPITTFDASANNITMTAGAPLVTASISGLGSGGLNVLDQATDFVLGVCNLTGKMMYSGAPASGTFTATDSGAKTVTSSAVEFSTVTGNPLFFMGPMPTTYQNSGLAPNSLPIYPRAIHWVDPQATADNLKIKNAAGTVVLFEAVAEDKDISQYILLPTGIRWNDFQVTELDSGSVYIYYST